MAGTAPVSLAAYAALLRTNRNFRLMWCAQFISEIGDWLFSVALYSLLLEQTGSARSVALAFVLQVLPQFFVAPAAGVINDRASRRRVMMYTDWARAVVLALMLVGQVGGFVWLLYLLLLLETVGWAMFEPARNAVIPNITKGDDERLAANALSSMTWSFTLAIGSGLGGLLAVTFGRTTVFVLDALSFVVSALLISRMRFAEPHLAEVKGLRPRDLVDFSHITEGLRYVRRNARLTATLFVKTGLALMGSNWVLLPVLGERVFPLQLGAKGATAAGMLAMSLLMGSRGLGALIGPFAASWLTGSNPSRLRLGILAGFLIGAAGYVLLGFSSSLAAACAAVVLAHGGSSISWVFSTTSLQAMTDDRFRGRVFSAEYAFHTLALSLVVWSVGTAVDAGTSVRTLAVATGCLLLIPAALWALALGLWARHE